MPLRVPPAHPAPTGGPEETRGDQGRPAGETGWVSTVDGPRGGYRPWLVGDGGLPTPTIPLGGNMYAGLVKRLTIAALAGALALGAAGCGGDDGDDSAATTTAADDSSTTAASGTDEPGDDGDTTTTADDASDPCVNDLTLSGSESADGPIEPGTFWADAGPHPDNTVDYDRTLELALAGFEIPVDEQFGRGVPVGVPEVPEGGIILTAYLSRSADQEPIAEGQQFTSETDAARVDTDGTINNLGVWAGSERLLIGDTTITITALTDDEVCGTIEGVAETDLQTFAVVEGSFVADRIQALEAADAGA